MNARHRSQLTTIGSVVVLVVALALGLLLISTPALAEAPTNDSFAGATWIESYWLPYSDFLYTGEATADPADPGCGGTDATVWYMIVPDRDMTLSATTWGGYTPTDYETSVSVYSYDGSTLSQVACAAETWEQPLVFEAWGGITYYFMVGAWGVGGDLSFSVEEVLPPSPPPANDDFGARTIIPDVPYWDWVDTSGATSVDDPYFCFSPAATVWYEFTPGADMQLQASTYLSSYDAAIAVVRGAPDAFSYVTCGYWSVSFEAYAGETYYFMVGSAEWSWTAGGSLYFSLAEALPPLTVELAIDPQGKFSSLTGAATVGGTITCSRPATVELSGQVSQFVGRLNTLRGYFYTYIACDGPTAWSASATPENGRFAGGHAQVSANVWAYDWQTGECAWAEASGTVTLSRAPK